MRERQYLVVDRQTGLPPSGWKIRSAIAVGQEWLTTLVNRGMATVPFPVPRGTPAERNAAVLDFVNEDQIEQAVALLDSMIRDEITYMNRNLAAPLRQSEVREVWYLVKAEVPADV